MNDSIMVPAAHAQSGEPLPRKRKQCKQRGRKWTKQARFPGQATFDLANDMTKVPFARSQHRGSAVDGAEDGDFTPVSHCTSCGMTTGNCSCDPIMKELDKMLEDAQKQRCSDTSRSLAVPAAAKVRDLASDGEPIILLQPETILITQVQLILEAKGIYASLAAVEKICAEIDQQQASTSNKLSYDQWWALTAQRRTLLHEQHDFYLACHHPLASPALRDFARKYGMPSRMWEHGVNGFLKSVGHYMPGMAEQMLGYLDFAYSMLEDLRIQVPALAAEWIECIKGLTVYCRELHRILQGDQSSWHCDTPCVSDRTPSQATPSFKPDCIEHSYQASTASNVGENGPISYSNMMYGDVGGCNGLQSNSNMMYGDINWWDGLQPNLEAGAYPGSSTNAHRDFYAAEQPHTPDDRVPRLPWGATLSQNCVPGPCWMVVGWTGLEPRLQYLCQSLLHLGDVGPSVELLSR